MQLKPIESGNTFGKDTMVRELLRPLTELLNTEGANEIYINKPHEVIVECGGITHTHPMPNLTMNKLMSLANAIATYTDQNINATNPILSAILPDKERIQIIVPPAVESDCVSITIRKPFPQIKSLEEYEAEGAFNKYLWPIPEGLDERLDDLKLVERKMISALNENRFSEFIRLAVRSKKNIAVVGDTGSGKTTFMKTICQDIPRHERLVTIEDVRELFLPKHDNCVHLIYSKGGQGLAKVTPSDLISSCMRMKPNRVLLAELRGAEAFDFLKLLTTGHSGSITSFHAESCALAGERYVFMSKEHDQAAIYDEQALKRLVALTIDIVIHIEAETIHDAEDNIVRVDRYISEVQYNPIHKLQEKYGAAKLHKA